MGLRDFAAPIPAQLSGGMRQRVCIARTLVLQPRLILLDEPFGALDQQTRLLMGDELLRLWRETGATVLLITHALDEAAMLSDRVGVMSARPGRFIDLVETGWPRDRDSRIVSDPAFGAITARLWSSLREESMKAIGRQLRQQDDVRADPVRALHRHLLQPAGLRLRAAAGEAARPVTAVRTLRGPLLLTMTLLVAWQLLHQWAGDTALTAPLPTLQHLWQMIGQKRFVPHVTETGLAFLQALAISWIGGVGIGVLLGGHKLSGEVAEPLLVGIYSLPKIALYPVILLLFGLGMPAKVAFGALHGIIPVALFTMNAVRNVNRTYLRAGRAMRLTPAQTIRYILIPATLPEIFTGLRIGFSLTLLGTMLGELFASQRGLGFLLMTAIDLNDVQTILAIAVLISLFAVAANSLLLAIDRHLRRGAQPEDAGR
jgi:NitT/TauT family transport system permease protein